VTRANESAVRQVRVLLQKADAAAGGGEQKLIKNYRHQREIS
jgi:hypothetical protein